MDGFSKLGQVGCKEKSRNNRMMVFRIKSNDDILIHLLLTHIYEMAVFFRKRGLL